LSGTIFFDDSTSVELHGERSSVDSDGNDVLRNESFQGVNVFRRDGGLSFVFEYNFRGIIFARFDGGVSTSVNVRVRSLTFDSFFGGVS